MKLNVGCGNVHRMHDYVHVDARQTPITDMVCDAWAIDLPDGKVHEIYSRHMLEHLPRHLARQTLRSWFHLLAPSGRLHVIVPDILFHARQLLGLESSIFPDQHEHAMAGFYGWCDPDRGGDIHDSHRWGYSFQTLGALLQDTGFIQVERITSGKDSEPWHLNVQAIKPGPSHQH